MSKKKFIVKRVRISFEEWDKMSDRIRLSYGFCPNINDCGIKIFKDDEYHMRRIAKHYVMVFMLEGTLYFTENGKEMEISEEECYIQKDRILQDATKKSPGAKYYYVHFTANECAESESGAVFDKRFIYDKSVLIPLLENLNKHAQKLPFTYFDCQVTFLEILKEIAPKEEYEEEFIQKLVSYLHDNIQNKLNYTMIADEFKVSQSYIKSTFKKVTGVSPKSYLNTIRMNRAANQITLTEKTLDQIAREVGFSDFPSFYRAFNSHYEITPGEYRALHRRKSF